MANQNTTDHIKAEETINELLKFDQFHIWNAQRYKNISGTKASDHDRNEVSKSGGHPGYGEVLPFAVYRMFKIMDLKENDEFLDLGSGTGKTVFQAALQFGIEAYGYEFSEFRHAVALSILEKEKNIHQTAENLLARIHLVQQDMIAKDLDYPENISVILFDGLLHENIFKIKVVKKIIQLIRHSKNQNKIIRLWTIGSAELIFPDDLILYHLKGEKCMVSWTVKGEYEEQQNTHVYWLSTKYELHDKLDLSKEKKTAKENDIKHIKTHINKTKKEMKEERKKYYEIYQDNGVNF